MKDGDVFRVLGWGLRRYGWIVAAFVLGLGVLVPTLLERVPDQYDAHAQVGPTEPLKLPNLDPLPRLGQTVFSNGAVAQAVRQSVNPPLPATANVVPERVELVAAQDNIVFTIVGHHSDPAAAERIANVAAATFAEELNKYGQPVGSFAIQQLATTPRQPVAKIGGTAAIGIGLVAGLVMGVGVVALLLVWRRPVVDSASAEQITDAPVLGRVLLSRTPERSRGLPQLCRRVTTGATDMLLLAGSPRTKSERQLLAGELARILGWTHEVAVLGARHDPEHLHGPTPVLETAGRRGMVIIDGPSQVEVATRPPTSVTLLVVREGIGHAALEKLAEQYLDDGDVGVVLVRRLRFDPPAWGSRLRGSRHRAEARPPRTWRPTGKDTAEPITEASFLSP